MKQLSDYSLNNDFENIKNLTLNIEKKILDTYKSDTDFNRLIDHITFYSDYSFFNTLLIDYQYPNFLSLGTKNKYENNGLTLSENAIPISVLSPNNNLFVKVKNNDIETIKNIKDLSKDELTRFNDINDSSITLDHKEFKGLNIISLYDCKDTNMDKDNYKHFDLPALFTSSYNDIYNSFVKAIYASGYKVKYCDNLDTKYSFDKDTKNINIKNGLNSRIKIKCMLDTFSSDITDNNFDKKLLTHIISKGIGFEDDFRDNNSLIDWYKKSNINDVDKALKLVSCKGRKFVNSFNKFYGMEEKIYPYQYENLYDDCKIAI